MNEEKIPKSDRTKEIERSILNAESQIAGLKGEREDIIKQGKKLGFSNEEIEKLLKEVTVNDIKENKLEDKKIKNPTEKLSEDTPNINHEHPEIKKAEQEVDEFEVAKKRVADFINEKVDNTLKKYKEKEEEEDIKNGILSNETEREQNEFINDKPKAEVIEINNTKTENEEKISSDKIEKRAHDIYDKRQKDGIEGNEKNDWEKSEKQLRDEQLSDIEKNLEETRNKYIREFKKNKGKMDTEELIHKTRNATFNILAGAKNIFSKNKLDLKNSVKPEDYFTNETREAKMEYNQARIKMGNAMYEQKKEELEKSGLSGEELKKALENYRSTEILVKTITDERQKIIDVKVIDRPAMWKKLLDGYKKMPRWQRVALSTALFTAAAGVGVASGGIFAGYGLATMAAMKFGTSMAVGSVVSQTGRGIDLIMKKSDTKFTETLENNKTDLKNKFGNNEINQEEYEKRIVLIEKEETKRGRNRTLLKAGIGIAVAGLAGHYAYDALGNGLHHVDSLHNATVDAVSGPEVSHLPHTEPSIEHHINTPPVIQHASIEATALHGQGAISTLRELQHNLKTEYGNNLENAPASVKHILNTDPNQLAKEYGMYKPGQDAESAFIKSGSSFKVDNAGNVTYHEIGGHSDITLEKGSEIKVNTEYTDKMADTDHSGVKTEIAQNNNYDLPKQVDSITGEIINTNAEPTNLIDNQYKLPPQVDPITGQPVLNEETINMKPESLRINNLSPENLEQVHSTFKENINHLFPNNEHSYDWDNVKGKTPDDLFKLEKENGLNEIYKPLTSYIHKLEEVTGLRPTTKSLLVPIDETNSQFIVRAMQKAQEMGQLDKIKL